MNANIAALYNIAAKPSRLILGLMSGTSFDGLDLALCRFTGDGTDTKTEVLQYITKDYSPDFKEDLKSVFAHKAADLERVTLLNAYIGTYHAQLVLSALEDWRVAPADIDVIASHGQTIFHAPKHLHPDDKYGNATLQIGDGDHIAVKTGIITLSDFRQKHIAVGGEGAPLALYGDYLLFSEPTENRIMLNIGGIANFTFLPARPSADCFSTDVGPGNTLMDQYVQQNYPGRYYDMNGDIAASGQVNENLLQELLAHPFFEQQFPKTIGPELFNISYLKNAIEASGRQNIKREDIIATLAKFTAAGIIKAIENCIGHIEGFKIYVSGGGMYNPVVINYLESHFKQKLNSTASLGIHPDAKEAVLFAVLANEALAGGNTSFAKSKNIPQVSMGKVSFPN